MNSGMRVVAAFAVLVAATGVAAAESVNKQVGPVSGAVDSYVDPESHGEGDYVVDAGEVGAAGEGGLYSDGNYGDLDSAVASDNASAMLDADGSMSDVDEAADGGFWSWIEVGFAAFVDSLRDVLGVDVDTPESVDASVEAYVSDDGVDLDASANALGETVGFDDSPVGDLDGATWDAMAKVHAAKGGVEDKLPA